jgi:two-component system response regulator NreC
LPVYGAYPLTMDHIDYSTAQNATHAVKPDGSSETIRILIVEDQPAVRKAIRMRLAAEADLLVIGEASDSVAALDLAMSLCPDVVLMDVEMPHTDGLTATSELRRLCPQTSVIILSIHDDELTQARARDAGAAAFVAKSMPPDTLLATIRQVSLARFG